MSPTYIVQHFYSVLVTETVRMIHFTYIYSEERIKDNTQGAGLAQCTDVFQQGQGKANKQAQKYYQTSSEVICVLQ